MTNPLRPVALLLAAPLFLTLRAADPAPANPAGVVIERAPEGDRAPSSEETARLQAENKRLAQEAAAQKQRADEAFARLNTLNTGVERLMQEKTNLTAQLNQTRSTETALREKLDAAEKTVAKLPPDVMAKLAETEKKLAAAEQRQAVLDADNQLLKTASAEQVRLTAELERMRQEKAAREAAAPSLDELKGKLAEAQLKLEAALRSYTLVQAENEQLKSAAARPAQPAPAPQADAAAGAASAELAKLRQENAALTTRADSDHAALTAELEALRRDKAALEAKLAAAPAEQSAGNAAKLRAAEEKLATSLRSYAQLQAENEQLKSAAAADAALRTELENLRRDHAALEAKLAENAPAAAPAPDVTARLADVESKLSTVLRSYTLLQEENDRLKADAARTVESAQATSAKAAADAAAQISALFDELRQAKAQVTTLSADNAQLKTRLALVGAPPGSTLAAPMRPGTAAADAAATPAPAKPAVAGPRTHVVSPGDTLAKISRTYYGTPSRWDEILRANRDVIKNENVLPLGATLKIP
jgi:LysM repeat protein